MIDQSRIAGKRAAWARFRSVAAGVSAAGLAAALAVLGYLRWTGVPMPWQARLAIALGVAASFAVAGVLMGLVFTSHRSGHDVDADRRDHEL